MPDEFDPVAALSTVLFFSLPPVAWIGVTGYLHPGGAIIHGMTMNDDAWKPSVRPRHCTQLFRHSDNTLIIFCKIRCRRGQWSRGGRCLKLPTGVWPWRCPGALASIRHASFHCWHSGGNTAFKLWRRTLQSGGRPTRLSCGRWIFLPIVVGVVGLGLFQQYPGCLRCVSGGEG